MIFYAYKPNFSLLLQDLGVPPLQWSFSVSFIFVIILVSIKKDESVIFSDSVVGQTTNIQMFLSTKALPYL